MSASRWAVRSCSSVEHRAHPISVSSIHEPCRGWSRRSIGKRPKDALHVRRILREPPVRLQRAISSDGGPPIAGGSSEVRATVGFHGQPTIPSNPREGAPPRRNIHPTATWLVPLTTTGPRLGLGHDAVSATDLPRDYRDAISGA